MTTAAAHTATGTIRTAEDTWKPAGTLAGEHALLTRDVNRRAASILALLDARVWPHAELGTLTSFLRGTVLRQASDEEALLFPRDVTAPPFAELSADHVRLHSLTRRLERARGEPGGLSELRALVGELLTTLHRHLVDEQAVLAALPDMAADVPSAAAISAGEQPGPADDAPTVIPLDSLPQDYAVQWCIERLLRLAPGHTAEIHSADAHKLDRVVRWLHAFDAVGYGVAHRAEQHHVLEVTRRTSG